MVQKRMLRVLPQWSTLGRSKTDGSIASEKYFLIVQKNNVFSFEFVGKEEEASKTTTAT